MAEQRLLKDRYIKSQPICVCDQVYGPDGDHAYMVEEVNEKGETVFVCTNCHTVLHGVIHHSGGINNCPAVYAADRFVTEGQIAVQQEVQITFVSGRSYVAGIIWSLEDDSAQITCNQAVSAVITNQLKKIFEVEDGDNDYVD